MQNLFDAVMGRRPTAFDPRYYDRLVKNTAEFRCSMHQEEYAFYAANNFMKGNVGFQGILSRKVKSTDSLHGAGVILLRVMEISHPEIGHDQRMDYLARFIDECASKGSRRLSDAMAGMVANLFTFLEYRGDEAGMDTLSRSLIANARTLHGKRAIQMVIAPSSPLPRPQAKLLYHKLREAIESEAPLSDWIKDNIGDRLMRRAYAATGFPEAISLSTRRDRGRILETELGI